MNGRQMRRTLDRDEPGDRDHEGDDELPRRDRYRVGVDLRPFQVDRAGRPAHGTCDRKREADEIARSEEGIDEDRQSRGAEQERNAARLVEPLAEDEVREQRRPDRHGVGEDRDPRGRGHELREGGEQREQGHVQAAGDGEVDIRGGAADPQAAALQQCKREQCQRREPGGAGAHAERGNIDERDLHRRPGQAPGQADRDQHQPGGGVGGCVRSGGGHERG